MAKSAEYKLAIRIAGKVDPSVASSARKASSLLGSIVGGNLITSGIQAAGRAVVDFVKDSIDTYASFEKSLTNAAAIANANAEEYKQLEEAARAAGKSTLFTAGEAADALGYMALAGWDVNTSTKALTPILKLAQATSADLATTADQVTSSMAALGVGVDDLDGYLDVVIKTNNSANTSASQLMDAFARSGNAIQTAGLSYSEAAVALGLLGNENVRAAEAGTALNSVIIRMATKTAALNAYAELGVDIYDKTTGKIRNLKDILYDTSVAMDGMTDAERNSYMAAMAGGNYYSEFKILLKGVRSEIEGGISSWDKIAESVYNADGALDTMNEKIMDTYSSKIAAMNSALDDLKIGFISAFGDDIQRLIVFLSESVIPKVSAAMETAGAAIHTVVGFITGAADVTERWNNWLAKNKTALTIAAIAVGALATALIVYNGAAIGAAIASGAETVAIGALIAAETAATVATTVFGAALAFLTSPITLIILAIGAAIAIGVALYQNWDTIKAKAQEMAATIAEKFPWLAEAVRVAGEVIKGVITAITGFFSGLIQFVKGVFAGDWDAAWNGIVNAFGSIFGRIATLAKTPLNAVIDLINRAIGGINSLNFDVPEWVPGVGGSHVGFNIPKIPRLAAGGIATGATLAEIGEGGEPEAVLPLSKLDALLGGRLGGGNVTFAPVINISGSGSRAEVQSAMAEAFAEFKRLMAEYEHDRRRRVFTA